MSADALVPSEATLEDVARAAGVSQSTASRVLNAFVRLIRRREVPASSWGNQNLRQAYSRATAYAAHQLGDATLAKRAWKEFRTGHAGYPESLAFTGTRIEGPTVLNPIDEAPFSTNASAQYGLAAMQCLALVGDEI